MRQQRVDSWWQQWTCVGGACAPPATPPRNRFEHLLDRYVDIAAPFIRGCSAFVTVAVVAAVSFALGSTGGLLLESGFFLAAGAYCLANFLRCREAHCVVTGLGWSALALAGLGGVLAGRDLRSREWIAFLLVALLGHLFEAVWRGVRGTNALRLGRD
ncbi:MAG TPA: hypothetical protein VFD49_22940 [Candidatus Dormibacteraeota bacterium]|nr:hypothetical protein [Candidatus Dormibacteraeota bacterium]